MNCSLSVLSERLFFLDLAFFPLQNSYLNLNNVEQKSRNGSMIFPPQKNYTIEFNNRERTQNLFINLKSPVFQGIECKMHFFNHFTHFFHLSNSDEEIDNLIATHHFKIDEGDLDEYILENLQMRLSIYKSVNWAKNIFHTIKKVVLN